MALSSHFATPTSETHIHMCSGLDSYRTCEVWGRSNILWLSYNNFYSHGETSKSVMPPRTRPLTKTLDQWFSNFLHQVPPQKIFGFPSTTIMTNIKMQYKWLPTAPGVCSRCVCVCVCVFTAVCVCTLWMG